eukprot:CAMPEP_0201479298 /NCGR_PEP_ID=MMETSP0151_2-20130828/4004_1 /ASSEMBLY_ACC=CAM_ASM_000257 /TAXON_ID=200890 /ORGANISM="Paramoeba atlantica, Strain 621/1 / CCAP 1560/9" /LENGTH=121 /DNA_ID=CAMNT_0047860711 /DNA_START=86 /DNA_END=448 /DNA_ORIENTATION=+
MTDLLKSALKANAVLLLLFALVTLFRPAAALWLTHTQEPQLPYEVHAVLRGWGAAALSLSFISYAMISVNGDLAKKTVLRGCFMFFMVVATGQILTFQHVTKWRDSAGYVLLAVEVGMALF